MAGSSFGKQFRITTWGESHGPAIGVVIDGCPSGIKISEEAIQTQLDRRRPGQSYISTKRSEPDAAEILSGVFEGITTGAPIQILIKNRNADSKAYDNIINVFRPGHADYTYTRKYGQRDHRGGGRASARETACRVAGGAVAREFLSGKGIDVFAHVIQIADVHAKSFDRSMIESNDVRCADADAAEKMIDKILDARKNRDSVGGIIEIRAEGVPTGLGEPVFDKFNADLAKALMSVNAVKGVEIGAGFAVASMYGSENNDQMRIENKKPVFVSNNSGGIDGGITNGNVIVARIAVKPTPSILKEQKTIDNDNKEAIIKVEGRHDPCVLPRAVPVAEAMTLVTIADHLLRNRAAQA
ncbi:Chorismate synthase [hydrothermal vent metagenome]|uniref:chorismate synthase n=1 Tax=hydrothermal vent metagenome TaxID=652676 RepID=A0A3B1BTX4_9ZZZZ